MVEALISLLPNEAPHMCSLTDYCTLDNIKRDLISLYIIMIHYKIGLRTVIQIRPKLKKTKHFSLTYLLIIDIPLIFQHLWLKI